MADHEHDGVDGAEMKPHERMALEFLIRGPDRIRTIDDENTLAAAIVYCDLEKRGLVIIDSEDGMLVTISPSGKRAIWFE